MEHLNSVLKSMLSSIGTNVNLKTIVNAGKCVHGVLQVFQTFQAETTKKTLELDKHPFPEFTTDFQKVLEVLNEVKKKLYPMEIHEHSCFNWKLDFCRVSQKKNCWNLQ